MILVTGGTGFVGRHLVRALTARGEAIRVMSRSGRSLAAGSDVEVVRGDLGDSRSLESAVHGVRAVVHVAARVEDSGDSHVFRLNVEGTIATARAAQRAGVERFIHVSSGGVYGDGTTTTPHCESDEPHPGTAYERSKLESERALAATLAGTDVGWTIVRPAGVYGQDRPATARFVEDVRTRAMWLHANSEVIVHPTHVSDVVRGCIGALDSESAQGLIVNLAGERALRFQELVALVASMLGRRARQAVMPRWLSPIAATTASSLHRAGIRPPVALDRAGRRVVNRALDTRLARALFNFAPVRLEDALRETVESLGRTQLAGSPALRAHEVQSGDAVP